MQDYIDPSGDGKGFYCENDTQDGMRKKVDLEHIHKDIVLMKKDIAFIKDALSDEGELSDWAKRELVLASKVPDKDLIPLEVVEREIKRKRRS
jgi:hypothetical protein